METVIGVFCTLITILVLFNTVLLIGIAGSLAKLLRYISGDDKSDRDRWSQILRQRRTLHMSEANQPTYADTVGLQVRQQPVRDQWDGMPRGPNWDGIPKIDEDD